MNSDFSYLHLATPKSEIFIGCYNYTTIIVKAKAPATIALLAEFIDFFRNGVFHNNLKRAKVIPLNKNGSKDFVNNHRHFSPPSGCSKIFERAMHTMIYCFFERFNLFLTNQFGFRKKHSLNDALAKFPKKNCHNPSLRAVCFFQISEKRLTSLIFRFSRINSAVTVLGVFVMIG